MTPGVLCPRCRARLVAGVLRCRLCGADARAARPVPRGVSIQVQLELVPAKDGRPPPGRA